ncbi:MAG TPA: pyruvate, phosphate dikinase [Bacillota bacterium]|nr:pyruvate, phosphate dikinase [Bacillota bacterium]HQE66934.1 pyruvate, phosphate dikinase [Bacillota bacterium]HQI16624.1 pyruvate, phosphate dikinase [Bacillota bacterium]HQJ37497.1 pyruvate, phosphate dikinase [Bacillota bacterium]HQL37322.1 pyruvate, phosphate dikinase [Bacillota bacterium]
MKKYVYNFKEGKASMKGLLGGKGANLAEMTNIGLPVPPGFTITTEACNEYYNKGEELWSELIDEIMGKLKELEATTGKTFGGGNNPLLVSVRSGAKFSMPGMMDTILNLGLNDEVVKTVRDITNNERFAMDSYRRFIQMFSDVVMEIPKSKFERVLDEIKEQKGAKYDTDLTASDLKEVVEKFKSIYRAEKGEEFPQNPENQLLLAVKAVFRSWNNERAIIYRAMNNIPGNLGTAVNVQSMVFGNMGNDCGTGVAFTRNPATGEKKIFGEFLMNAQGEDVVAGIRTPQSIEKLNEINQEVYDQFINVANLLENHYKDMQDIEFTIEKGKLFMLQTRNGKRTAAAALRVAVELVEEGKITKEEAVLRVEPAQLDQLLHPNFDSDALKKAVSIAKGLPASPGAASGKVYFTAADAVEAAKNGEKVILVRLETSPEDIEGMAMAQGILTARGGMTSHAAVVARGMGKCCVAGCEGLKVSEELKQFEANGKVYKEGDFISLNGSTGYVYEGVIPTKEPEMSGHFGTLMSWADEVRRLKVRTNADTPKDAAQAVKFGAEGIGLCRTEHMFFSEDRIAAVREMIISETVEQRKVALAKLLPMQKEDFIGIFEAMEERPVTIRLLDPPLHEFLPQEDEDIKELAKTMGVEFEKLKARVESLHEFNPMLGHRGCRLAVTYPELAEMQARAIIEAAVEVKKNKGIDVHPEIMIPLVGELKELEYIEKVVRQTADKVIAESGIKLEYLYGTMIEVPRGAVTADEIAKTAEFFSFGTNDLTQMTYGFSRDDAGKFIEEYVKKGIFDQDPFQTLDQNGVGKLVKMAVDLGRKTRPDIKLGICGEHGGDPASVEFCHRVGLNYVSCSPFRVPIARLAAAHATIKDKMGEYSQK